MKLITRRAALLRPPRRVETLRPTRGVAVHYSGSAAEAKDDHSLCAGVWRAIQRYHMDTKGWLDVAYSYGVCNHGFVFEGRGAHARTAANGTNDGNTGYLAICFLGGDKDGRRDVTDAGREALVDCRRHLLRIHPSARRTVGHRDIVLTECPGDELYGFIHSPVFANALELKEPVSKLPGESPKPKWWWEWMVWMDTGRLGPRPASVQLYLDTHGKLPEWAWEAREIFLRRRRDH